MKKVIGARIGMSLLMTVMGLATFAPHAAANPYSGADDAHVQFFRSPTGNIQCEINFGRAPAAAGAESLPDGVYCMSQQPLQSVQIRADGSLTDVCTGPTCGSDGPTDQGVLAYGQSAVLGPFTCLSEESGMTCTANGRGFEISTAGIFAV
ncbi:MAG: hypothetical protein PGN27_09760 [Mycolicibacterium neoaurum]|uniref:hypothetical protein n=1 Tax=Mycolicibacterium neoaurum TaxID=1795 RepID=UPI002FF59918